MKERTAAGIAWSLWVFTIVLSIASWVFIWLSRAAQVPDVIGFRGFDAVLAVAFSTVGAIVAARRPSNAVGWLLLAFGAANAPVSLLQQYAFFAVVGRDDALIGGIEAAWAQEVLAAAQGAIFVLLLLLFPTGRLVSPRWRPVAAAAVAASPLETAGAAFVPGPIVSFTILNNPFGLSGLPARIVAVGDAIGNVLFVATLLAAVTSTVVRYRRAEPTERQQLKWIAAAGVLVAIGLVAFVLTGQEAGRSSLARPVQIFLILAVVTVPMAAGIAVLRYRLYGIDRIITRTLSYAIITTVLGGVFTLVALMPTLVAGSGDSPDWLIAVATLLVFAFFRPLRRRVQRVVDRRFNRARYDAAQTIEAFSARLREQTDLDSLRTELTAVVGQTMQPTHVSLWLRSEG